MTLLDSTTSEFVEDLNLPDSIQPSINVSAADSSNSTSPLSSTATSPSSIASFSELKLDSVPPSVAEKRLDHSFEQSSSSSALLSTSQEGLKSRRTVKKSENDRSPNSNKPHARRKGLYQKGISEYIHKRQLKISTTIILSLYLLNQIPVIQPYTQPFLSISYVDPATQTARIGPADGCFVFFWIVVLTFTRSLILDNLLVWVGRNVCHIKSKKTTIRFAEQGYALLQYFTFFVVGAVLLSRSPYWFSAIALWEDWPVNTLQLPLKTYYLIQLSIWVQQIYVINIEERRKDHWQMFIHHIVTCALIVGSYQHYLTRVGHVIMVIMDVVDIFLSLAKVLRYLGYQTPCDVCFIIFLGTWMFFRHGIYNYVLYSAFTDAYHMLPRKCFYDEKSGELIRCFTDNVYWTLVGLLAFLQLISIAWLYMIVRVLIKVLKGDAAADSRSDEEDEDDD